MEQQHNRIRTASQGDVTLAHPTPDLQSLQGAYIQNVERLEERAERMSVSSDLGEEIRKLQQEQKLNDSRRASLRSNAVEPTPRSRNVSMSSYANSIVEVNSAARMGHSPGGYLTSPIGSLRSGSWSQVSYTHSNPARSLTKSSRLSMISDPQPAEEMASSSVEESALNDASSNQHTPRQNSKSGSTASSGRKDEDTRDRRMKRLSTGRLPSDGSYTELFNQLTVANKSTADLSTMRIPSDTSFTDIYDQIAGEIRDTLDTSVIDAQGRRDERSINEKAPAKFDDVEKPTLLRSALPTPPPLPPPHGELPGVASNDFGVNFSFASSIKPQDDSRPVRLQQHRVPDEEDEVNRPRSTSSQDTYQQAEAAFQDFDGTHYAPSMMSRLGSLRDPSGSSMFPIEESQESNVLKMLQPPESMTNLVPPPNDGMVFYPAPVPRTLNLPQRISQAPSAAVLAKRKTQLLASLPEAARKSAPWLSQNLDGLASSDARASKMNLSALPPQLRASVFFDPGVKRMDLEVKNQSAVRTLENLLDASAMAPVGAFTDHPIVGKVGKNIYRKSIDTRSSMMDVRQSFVKKQRKSSFLGLRRSSKTSEVLLDDEALERRLNQGELEGAVPVPGTEDGTGLWSDNDDEDEEEGGVSLLEEEEEEEEQHIGAPTTLLAELEMRKLEQKSRNRNAYNSFPNGMHSTLLEMDDVQQLKTAKRKKRRVALAWEGTDAKAAANDEDDEDEDVPLGVLYAGKSKIVQAKLAEQGLADWNRPLGLLEKKQFEDNEPLSRRRMRLLGVNPNAVRPSPVESTSPMIEVESESDHEGETLGQRKKRLMDKKALDATIGDIESRPISQAFSVDLLSQLGMDTKEEAKPKSDTALSRSASQELLSNTFQPKSPGGGLLPPPRSGAATPGSPVVDSEEETLGQRRARLQRENARMSRRQSQLTLNMDAQTSYFPNQGMAPTILPTPAITPPLRSARSMADILAAYPTGKHDARKVSNEMLMAAAPQGSLLAQEEEKMAARRARMKMSSAEMLGNPKPNVDRQYSGAYVTGAMNYQQQMVWQQGYAGMSQPNLLGAQQYPQQMGMGMGANGYAAMSNPNLLGGVQGYPGYGAGFQRQPSYGVPPTMYRDPEPCMDPNARSRVDNWRQSIAPS